MTIPTEMSLQGFIATDSGLHFSENGVARFSTRVGVRQVHQNAVGSTPQLEPTFGDLVMFREIAERAYERLPQGRHLRRHGPHEENPYEGHGRRIVHEEFIARHIGHDLVLTAYVVARTQPAPPDPDPDLAPPNEPVPELVVGLCPGAPVMHWQEGYDGPADHAALIDERDLETYLPPELLGGDDELRPVDWNTLPADEAEGEWYDLNGWVDWIRKSHGFPATVIAPLWHRHDEMVWELSAQHLSFRASYHRDAPPTAPAAWRRDFWDAQQRLRQTVAACRTRIDRDRPTRVTAWPGEPAIPTAEERVITNRAEDFEQFVAEDIAQRREREARTAA